MYQLSIDFFWPLTEQISLDLDYTPCEWFAEEKRAAAANSITSQFYTIGSSNISIGTLKATHTVFQSGGLERIRLDDQGISFNPVGKAGSWEVTPDFHIYRETKPSWIVRTAVSKVFGWKWKDV